MSATPSRESRAYGADGGGRIGGPGEKADHRDRVRVARFKTGAGVYDADDSAVNENSAPPVDPPGNLVRALLGTTNTRDSKNLMDGATVTGVCSAP
jgi:hypothetical protein